MCARTGQAWRRCSSGGRPRLAYLIARLQEAFAAESMGGKRIYLKLGDRPEETDLALRTASGFQRLVDGVDAAGLWPVIEDRNVPGEERQLSDRCVAMMKARGEL